MSLHLITSGAIFTLQWWVLWTKSMQSLNLSIINAPNRSYYCPEASVNPYNNFFNLLYMIFNFFNLYTCCARRCGSASVSDRQSNKPRTQEKATVIEKGGFTWFGRTCLRPLTREHSISISLFRFGVTSYIIFKITCFWSLKKPTVQLPKYPWPKLAHGLIQWTHIA